jgi:cbb3-type cytochrome oxidase maturation protein
MEVLFLIIPISLILVGLILAALFWAVRSHQFDDLDRAGMGPIIDDDRTVTPQKPLSDPTAQDVHDNRNHAPSGRPEL